MITEGTQFPQHNIKREHVMFTIQWGWLTWGKWGIFLATTSSSMATNILKYNSAAFSPVSRKLITSSKNDSHWNKSNTNNRKKDWKFINAEFHQEKMLQLNCVNALPGLIVEVLELGFKVEGTYCNAIYRVTKPHKPTNLVWRKACQSPNTCAKTGKWYEKMFLSGAQHCPAVFSVILHCVKMRKVETINFRFGGSSKTCCNSCKGKFFLRTATLQNKERYFEVYKSPLTRANIFHVHRATEGLNPAWR